MKTIHIILMLLLSCSTFAQKHDYQWINSDGFNLFNYPSLNLDYNIGVLVFDFNDDTLSHYAIDSFDNWGGPHHTTYCNKEGELLLYSKGGSIYNYQGDTISGGSKVAINQSYIDACCILNMQEPVNTPLSINFAGSSYFLPLDNQDSLIAYVQPYAIKKNTSGIFTQCFFTLIENNIDSISVIDFFSLLPFDDYENPELNQNYGIPISTRAANGRDWWVLVPDLTNLEMVHKILISKDSFYYLGFEQLPDFLNDTTEISPSFGAHMIFTQNGNSLIIGTRYQGIYVFDFDRCNGNLLYTGKGIDKVTLVYSPGSQDQDIQPFHFMSIVSPDDHYYYVPVFGALLRYDLWAEDFSSSEDTVFYVDTATTQFQYGEGLMRPSLGPNGEIYIFSNSPTYQHVIHNPCETNPNLLIIKRFFIPQHITLQDTLLKGWSGVNTFPHYRLGPIDGSACDSLGIDNNPLAAWNYTPMDTLGSTQFWDITDYEPTNWQWDFGDGDTSMVQNPLHQYDKGGAYWVCLIVSNENSADTLCKWVYIQGTTPVNEQLTGLPISVYPNPLSGDMLNLDIPYELGGDALLFELTDVVGRVCLRAPVHTGKQQVRTGTLPAGTYVYRLLQNNTAVSWGKLVVGR